jgi:crotonobetainyl-CoA:carnitine CoA-transferase CaiB-like acyl-CoA transferase
MASDRPWALAGVRVLDFTRLGFGSQATLILGCLGAEVIRVESRVHPDPVRVMPPYLMPAGERSQGFGGATLAARETAASLDRGGVFFKYNTGGKRSIAVDARHPDGLAVLERLVAVSDIVTESFAAGTLARWGLPWSRLRELKPDLVYVSMCGYGHTGPESSFVTMGPTAQALTGLTHLVGLPGRPPCGWSFSYLDHVGGYLGAIAALTGLAWRRRTGEGQHIDVSQLEPATALMGPLLLDVQANGRTTREPGFPPGNRRGGAPQGAYPCAGDDTWLVISCTTEDHWRRFVDAIGAPAWTADTAFAMLDARRAHADDLDERVSDWARAQERYDAMARLQRAGVPAGVVQDARDRLDTDPQLAARGHFTRMKHAVAGEVPLEGVPFRMSATPPATGGVIDRGPPCLGEDTDAVLRDVLAFDAAEIDALHASGAVS